MYEVVHRPGGFTSDPNEALHRAIVFAMKNVEPWSTTPRPANSSGALSPTLKETTLTSTTRPSSMRSIAHTRSLQNFVASASVTQGGHAKPLAQRNLTKPDKTRAWSNSEPSSTEQERLV